MNSFQLISRNLLRAAAHPLDYGKRMYDYLVDESRKRRLVAMALQTDDLRFAEECRYLREAGTAALPFPYPRATSGVAEAEIGIDREAGFPYVLHRGNRLYFRRGTDPLRIAEMYRGFLDEEGLTGAGRLVRSPHAYESDGHRVERGDVLLDVGCSEAIFALEHVDLASRVYLFEAEPAWKDPLERTFAPFAERVPISIIPKLVSGESTANSVRLTDAVADESDRTYFLKMDIEGYEYDVLAASADFLRTHRVKLSCCTYHRQSDYDRIASLLKELGYTVTTSPGYMLLAMNGIEPPYFRHGVIYARNY